MRQKHNAGSLKITKRDDHELLKMWYDDLSSTDLPPLFYPDLDESEMRTLAFVVDDTGSMTDDINTVKKLIKAIIEAERTSPFFYILGTFNDPGNDNI